VKRTNESIILEFDLVCFCCSHKTVTIQGGFEICADILTGGRTPQKVTIEPIMPYRNVDIFWEKEAKSFSKKFGIHWILRKNEPKKKS
jgi:hypothetical protein